MTKQTHFLMVLAVMLITLSMCKSAPQSAWTDRSGVNFDYNYPIPRVFTEKRPFCNAFAGKFSVSDCFNQILMN